MSSPFSRTTNSLARDSADNALIAIGVAGGLIILWTLWFMLSRVTVYETSRTARLEAGAAPWLISTSLPGRIRNSRLTIGRTVKAGDILVELDNMSDTLRVSEAEAMLKSLEQRARALRSEIASLSAASQTDRQTSGAVLASGRARLSEADAGLSLATDTESRMQAQAAIGGVADLDAKRARAEALKLRGAREALIADTHRSRLEADVRVHQTIAQISALQGELAGLEGATAAKRAEVERMRVEANERVIRAPVDGVIGEAASIRPGTVIGAGVRLATVVPRNRLLIVASFDPRSTLGRLRPGQIARMELDGFPWAQFGSVRARVVRVASETRNSLMRVELTPIPQPGSALVLRHGLTGSVEVNVERVSPLTLALRSAGLMWSR